MQPSDAMMRQCAEIAELLEGDWEVSAVRTQDLTVEFRGEGIVFRVKVSSKNSDRYQIYGYVDSKLWEIYRYVQLSEGSITVARARDPEALAGEIQKRFLPVFLEYYREVMRRTRARDQQLVDRDANAEMLECASGGLLEVYPEVRHSLVSPDRSRRFVWGGERRATTLDAAGTVDHDEIEFNIRNLTPAQANRVAALLAEFEREASEDEETGDDDASSPINQEAGTDGRPASF